MKKNSQFNKYYSRLMWEGILKSLIIGFIVGFAMNFIVAAIFWAFDIKNFWLSIIIGFVVGGLLSILLYFKVYVPTDTKIAKRIDRMGLEERLITMTEFEGDNSYIATRQREDAKVNLNKVEVKSVKFRFKLAPIIFCAIAFTLATTMSTVAGLSESGVIKKGSEIIEDIIPPAPVELVEVSYLVEEIGGGFIDGEAEQIIEKGTDTTTVYAIPDDGYIFYGWSDGNGNPTRSDFNVLEGFTVYAVFLPLSEGEGEGKGEPGEGEPNSESEPKRENQNAKEESDNIKDPGATGKYEETNQIIDGNTYYRDVYEDYYAQAMEALTAREDIPDDLRKLIETYMGSIK